MTNFIGKAAERRWHFVFWLTGLTVGIAALFLITGCESDSSQFMPLPPSNTHSALPVIPEAVTNSPTSTNPPATTTTTTPPPATYTLREGEILKISFPGSPNLNSVQQIRTDGKITLPLIGEVSAAGLTPDALKKKLMDLYAPQLSTKEITVEVQSSAFPVYVTGAVLRPGKILSDHPITALEAIMEAGGFDYNTANLKNVRVIRQEAGKTKHYTLNLKRVLDGNTGEPFQMKPNDIIYVPQKFSWF